MPSGDDLNARLRELPRVDAVLDRLVGSFPRVTALGAARRALDLAREAVRSGADVPGIDDVVSSALELLADGDRRKLVPVINATGVLVHTNLGRVPLGPSQLEAVARVATGYSNLEYDLVGGKRGSRYHHAGAALAALTGAESALVVNNNAAAVLLMLAGLCGGREVIISRGELIEIGGEFRIPDVMTFSGTKLVEVGTTNRTHLADYERAITPQTAAILKVHPSNYRVVGFTSEVAGRDLARLARGRGLLFLHDLGSGLIEAPAEADWTDEEPLVGSALSDGADVVTFSGDKLLGGPQAGILAGRQALIESLSSHPLLRALRVDKMTLAALEATLGAYLAGDLQELPLWQLAAAPIEALRDRAGRLAAELSAPEIKAEATPTSSVAGGGSLPGTAIGSWGVTIAHSESSPDEIARALRAQEPPVIARIDDDRLIIDLRSVPPSDDEALLDSLRKALRLPPK